jgi:hypothetical protein
MLESVVEFVRVNIFPFLTGGTVAILFRESVSGYIKEWTNDHFTEKRRKRKEVLELTNQVIDFITADNKDLTKDIDADRANELAMRILPYSKKLSEMLRVYKTLRMLVYSSFIKPSLKKPGTALNSMDYEVIKRTSKEYDVMHLGILEETNYLRGSYGIFHPFKRGLILIRYWLYGKRKWAKKLANEKDLQTILKEWRDQS